MAIWRGTIEQRENFKKATANMMVFWAVNTRQDLRYEVINMKLDGQWVKTGVPAVLGDDEWAETVSIVSKFIKRPDVSAVMDAGYEISFQRWAMKSQNAINPCPPNEVIRGMIDGAMNTIDSEWLVTEDAVGV